MSRFPELALRRPDVVLAAILSALAFLVFLDLPFFNVSYGHLTVPYSTPPGEYICVLLALFLVTFLAPRFTLWEELGGRRVALQAAISSIIVLSVPTCVSAVSYGLTYPADGRPPLATMLHIAPNVFAMAALCYLLVAYLGRGWGTMAFLTLYYVLLLLAAEQPHIALYFPRTMLRIDGELSAQILWWWLLPLLIATVLTAYYRRSLPLFGDRT